MFKHRLAGIAAAIVALAGCDQVFGLDTRPAPDSPAIPSDAAPVVMSIDPVTDVAINETVSVTAHIVGPPNMGATYELTATRGSFDQPTGSDLIGPSGELVVTVMYRSPATPGAAILGVNVAGTSKTTAIDVLTRSFEGNDVQLSTRRQFFPLSMYAVPINVTRPGTLRSIGMRNYPSAANVRFAVYRNDATRTKITETAPLPVIGGRTEVPAPHEIIMGAGTYWVAMTLDASTELSASTGTAADLLDYQSQIFSNSFPADLSGTSRSTGERYALFIELAYSSGL